MLGEYEVDGLLLRAVQSLYCWGQSFVRIAGSKSDPFLVRVGLRQGCLGSPALFRSFMDRISSLLFADVVVLLPKLNGDLQLTSGCPPVGVGGSGWREEHLDFPAQAVAPMTRIWIGAKKETKRNTCQNVEEWRKKRSQGNLITGPVYL